MAGILSLKTPSNGLVTLTPTDTATNIDITVPATSGSLVVQDGTSTTTLVNVSYSGTLTGGTGVVNIGSGQVYKDASGNVGIGNIDPVSYLDVGDTSSTASMNSSGEGQFRIRGGEQTLAFAISSVNLATIYTNSNSGALAFGTNEIERARIESSGNFQVGVTSSSGIGGLSIIPLGSGAGSCATVIWNKTSTASQSAAAFRYSGSNVGSITYTSTATSFNTTSDYRLKENVAPMTGALATVAALKPVTYTWKVDGSAGQGFIAHELQAVVPDCVTGEKDAVEIVDDLDAEGKKIGTKEVPRYQGVDTSFLVATLVSAIQEQQTIIANLTTRLEALEAI
jgi:hypothetical protein